MSKITLDYSDKNTPVPVGKPDSSTVNNQTSSGSATQVNGGAVLAPDTGIVEFSLEQNTYVEFGDNPTATTSSRMYIAGSYQANIGTAAKASVLQVSSGGVCSFQQLI